MNTKYKAVLFDLDGTLLDTLQDITDSVNEALRCLGYPQHKQEAYKYFVGEGREIMAIRSLPERHRDPATVSKLVDLINVEYAKRWAVNTRPYHGITALLDELTAKDVKMAVLSNKADELTKMAVSTMLSEWQFEAVAGALPDVPRKPDPTAALRIARSLGFQPAEFIYLGDSDTDMKTAASAGMYPAGASWGFRTPDELIAGGARTLIEHPCDLLRLL